MIISSNVADEICNKTVWKLEQMSDLFAEHH